MTLRSAALAFVFFAASPAFAQGVQGPVGDAVAVRFVAPDIGGVRQPRFITRRQVSFEARLLALEEDPSGVVQPRHVHAAIDAHVAEEILRELPLEPRADPATVTRTIDTFRAALEQRVGGKAAIERAEKIEGVAPAELDAILDREARAAIYLDRSFAPFLAINEDRLRETYRTTSNPFRGRRFEDVRDDLARWMTVETFRAAEQSYLQTARSRINVVYF